MTAMLVAYVLDSYRWLTSGCSLVGQPEPKEVLAVMFMALMYSKEKEVVQGAWCEFNKVQAANLQGGGDMFTAQEVELLCGSMKAAKSNSTQRYGTNQPCYEAWEDSGRAARPETVTYWVVTVPELSKLISIVLVSQAANVVNPQKHPDAICRMLRPKPSQPFWDGRGYHKSSELPQHNAGVCKITLHFPLIHCARSWTRPTERIKLPTCTATLQQLDNVVGISQLPPLELFARSQPSLVKHAPKLCRGTKQERSDLKPRVIRANRKHQETEHSCLMMKVYMPNYQKELQLGNIIIVDCHLQQFHETQGPKDSGY
ncbi:uncharacterized protein EI90DRAFT_3019552 [Cantharellus anzutake]|uniref:uncharacterized protein n=1 Tax=Cantharellus anzutake TaxID=1750568 RepID=UPI0019089BEE|nr:uncharacterized protein EI90DRAFT_3019552 [Cantharellus anzutake]KAF8324414.1 hypothetical protein EI90DRAFT_3019552 [Cantharellus anzutake]